MQSYSPDQTTIAVPLPRRQGFGLEDFSYPSSIHLHGLWGLFHYQMRNHQAISFHVNVKLIHVHATDRSLSLREEGELVCNGVTPVE